MDLASKIIISDNKKCQLQTKDTALLNRLKAIFSYKLEGIEYAIPTGSGWDGTVQLIDARGKFSFGLLNNIKNYLKNHNYKFQVEDSRPPAKIEPELDISHNLKKYNFVPRDYQQMIVDTAFANQRGIIRACTGSGKTLCTALLTAKINKPTIIYVVGLDLLQQFHELFSKLFDEKIGYVGNGVCDIQRINIASIWTIGRSLNVNAKELLADEEDSDNEIFDESNASKINKMLEQTKVHILDECHCCTTATISSIYKKIDVERLYGFSGTPYRDENVEMLVNSILGSQIVDVSASDLIERKILAQPLIKFVSVPPQSMPMGNYQQVYKNYIVENEDRNNLILKSVQELVSKKYTTLVLFRYIRHGEILKELFENNNISCELLSGKDDLERRTEVKKKIESGELNVVLASTIFDQSVDLPKLSSLVLSGGGRSSIRVLQRVGRILRSYKGKSHVAVVDFFDQIKYLKKHSAIRYKIYQAEKGFKLLNNPMKIK